MAVCAIGRIFLSIFFEGGEPFLFYPLLLEKLAHGLPMRPWRDMVECPHEKLESPSRVHVDAFGHVQFCQGISIGNMWAMLLAKLMADYQPHAHPVYGPLIRGGPAELARALGRTPVSDGIDACHLCYRIRRAAIGRYPGILAPRQVCGG